MPNRAEMEALGQQIIAAHDDRVRGIADRRVEVSDQRAAVQAMVKGLDRAHQAMARGLHAGLARDCGDRRAGVGSMLRNLDSARQAMGRGLRAELARDCGDRRAAVSDQRAAAQAMVKDLDRAHQAMGRELRAELARDCGDRRAGVGSMLKGLDRAHQTMARGLRAELDRDCSDRRAGVAVMIKELQTEQAGLRKEQADGRTAWRESMAAMQARRGGSVAAPPPAIAPVPPTREEMAEEEAVARVEVGEVTAEVAVLRDRVFEYLANHPDGTKLVELEADFGVGRFQISRVLKSLMDENKVEKRELLYFAV
ncbi:MAG: hypothetical protein HYX88_01505 [Chloroflexi bacterium]|nr:hypothetical protein [Chloroflexota bacterium]